MEPFVSAAAGLGRVAAKLLAPGWRDPRAAATEPDIAERSAHHATPKSLLSCAATRSRKRREICPGCAYFSNTGARNGRAGTWMIAMPVLGRPELGPSRPVCRNAACRNTRA